MDNSNKQIGFWLLIGAFLVIAMVILGGYTRLSHSGLSMVDWKPVTGFIPPMSDAQWEKEFSLYKTSPEYIKRNYNFTVEEFKTIFWPEFLHRLLGRVIGFVFLIPFLYFLFTGKFRNKKLTINLIIIFLLGGFQGLIGWYMVKSGLVNIPSVSHYRLTIHFITALVLYVYILWTALGVFYPSSASNNSYPKIRKLLNYLLGALILQLIYGALVAGLKAGLIFPTFPKMNSEWVPESLGMALDVYGVKSFTEFPALVQFIHRWLAVVVVGLVVWIYIKGKRIELSSFQSNSLLWMLIVVLVQFLLGVFTLILLVPISLGVLHQLGAVLLLTTLIFAIFSFRTTKQV